MKEGLWLILVFSIGGLFSCGFAKYNLSTSNSDVTVLDSRVKDDSTGEFNSPKGRLESSDTCSKSEDCKALCDSMLQRFFLQKKCYDYKEVEVQAFRDTYNLLALGNPRKLARVDTEKMEKFLTFGPELWRDAIYGFERQRKEDCTPNTGDDDPTEREDCKLEGYYRQEGYWSEGAVATLEWIARNDWLAEFIVRHDEDLVIMTSLLNVLANGGGQVFPPGDSDREQPTVRDETCNLTTGSQDLQTAFASYTFSVEEDNQYKAFGANCVGKGKNNDPLNYFILAVDGKNNHSLNLGYKVVDKKLCDEEDACIKHFFCNIKYGFDATDPPGKDKILGYMKIKENLISDFNYTDTYCD